MCILPYFGIHTLRIEVHDGQILLPFWTSGGCRKNVNVGTDEQMNRLKRD